MSNVTRNDRRTGRPAGSFRAVIVRYPFASFVVLACALSWWLVPVTGFPLGSGPTLAALAVLAVTEGRGGIKRLFSQIVKWRVHWGWYAAAILLPTVGAVGAAAVTIWMGAPQPAAADWAGWTAVPMTFLFVLMVPVLGPWEEPGFRGFALGKMLNGRSPLVAGLAVGVLHVFWHVPLFFTGDIPPADVVYILAASVVFAWIVVGTKGSVLMAMVMHAASNAVSGEFISPMFTGADADLLGWARALIWCVFAGVVVVAAGREFVSRSAKSELLTV